MAMWEGLVHSTEYDIRMILHLALGVRLLLQRDDSRCHPELSRLVLHEDLLELCLFQDVPATGFPVLFQVVPMRWMFSEPDLFQMSLFFPSATGNIFWTACQGRSVLLS